MIDVLVYATKLPVLLSWNIFLTFVYTVQLLWRVKRVLWDPRTWITVGFFYIALNVLILFFQVFLDVLLLFSTGKTLSGLLPNLGNYISNYGLSSAISVLIFTTIATYPVVLLMEPARKLRVFRGEVLEEIVNYNKEYVLSRLKRGVVIVLLGVLLKLLLG